jgi:uncharacterized protein
MIVDLFEFARHAEQASGTVAVSELTRVDTPHRDGELEWSARGSMRGRHGTPRLDIEIDGAVTLTCQRCLQPMIEPVHIASRFLIANGEDEADALDQDDDYDVVIGSTAFDLVALVEDEVILALAIAPRHDVCPTGETDASTPATRPSAFAALSALRTGADPKNPKGRG